MKLCMLTLIILIIVFVFMLGDHAALRKEIERLSYETKSIYDAVHSSSPSPSAAETCIVGTYLFPDDMGGFVELGERDICGVNLHFGDVMRGYVPKP